MAITGASNIGPRGIPFRAEADGEYWFALRTLNRDRQLVPEGKIQPGLKIVVDTVKPKLDFLVDSDPSGRVICEWDARDPNLAPAKIQIQYRDLGGAANQSWQPVPIETATTATVPGVFKDRIAWWPDTTTQALEIRISVEDTAGNRETASRQVQVAAASWRNQSAKTAYPSTQGPQNSAASNSRIPAKQAVSGSAKMVCKNGVCKLVKQGISEEPVTMLASQTSTRVGSEVEWASPPNPQLQKVTDPSAATSQLETTDYPKFKPRKVKWTSKRTGPIIDQRVAAASTQDLTSAKLPNETPARPVPEKNWQENTSIRDLPGGMVVAEATTSRSTREPPMAQLDPAKPWQGRGDRAATPPTSPKSIPWQNEAYSPLADTPTNATHQFSNSNIPMRRAGYTTPASVPASPNLNQDLSGVQITNKKRFQLDYAIDAIDPSGVDKVVLWMTRDGGHNWKSWSTDPDNMSPFPVQVEEEGLYGFRIVVQSRDGLTGLAPRRGDPPDIAVRIDTGIPSAKITSVPYGRGAEAGRLVIHWEASDPLMAEQPVSLFFRPNPDGDWQVIKSGLANTGRYVWKVGMNVPERVYLKIQAQDQAGNIGEFQLPQMIDLSGLVPKGHIRGILTD